MLETGGGQVTGGDTPAAALLYMLLVLLSRICQRLEHSPISCGQC